jgi:hypothetical protein
LGSTGVSKRSPHFGGEKYNLKNAAERHASVKDSLPSLVDWTAAGAVTPVKKRTSDMNEDDGDGIDNEEGMNNVSISFSFAFKQ